MLQSGRSLAMFAMFVIVAGVTCAPALHAAESPISEAEQKVFLDDHLHGVAAPAVVRYRFSKTGTLERHFDDAVMLTIKPKGRAARTVEVSYLTGEHKVMLPVVEDAKANPVILYFLEQDVREMHRRLGGSENYFRRRIRLALAEAAQVRPLSVLVNGKQVAASEVVIRPYVDDPMTARLGPFVNKSYAFTLSDQVPGGVVQVRSRVDADAAAKGGPAPQEGTLLLDESLSFEKTGK